MTERNKTDPQTIRYNYDRLLNTPLRYDATTRVHEMDLPGFSYSNFNRIGFINFWSLMKSMEAIIKAAEKDNPTGSSGDDNFMYVVAAQIIDVHPKLYKDASIFMPVTVSIRPAHVSNRSYSIYTDLKGKDTGFQYLRCQRSIGFLDKNNRKGIPMPEHVKEVYEKVKDPHAKQVFIDQPKPPDHALKFFMTILHSDTDDQSHSNQTSYFRYCLDAAAVACDSDKLSNFHGDFFCYKISRAEILYKKETVPGDELEITFWEDEQSPNALHFIISANDKTTTVVNFIFFQDDQPPGSRL